MEPQHWKLGIEGRISSSIYRVAGEQRSRMNSDSLIPQLILYIVASGFLHVITLKDLRTRCHCQSITRIKLPCRISAYEKRNWLMKFLPRDRPPHLTSAR